MYVRFDSEVIYLKRFNYYDNKIIKFDERQN